VANAERSLRLLVAISESPVIAPKATTLSIHRQPTRMFPRYFAVRPTRISFAEQEYHGIDA